MRIRGRTIGRSSGLFVVGSCLACLLPGGVAAARDADPANRGIDLFIHTAQAAFAGDRAVVDLQAYGFPTVTTARPLGSAKIIAAWDPETLGPGTSRAPDAVTVTTDATGAARVELPVPEGDARALTLLLSVTHGAHTRTRTVQVKRLPELLVDVRVPDTLVVAGSRVPAWVSVVNLRSARPVPHTAVDIALLEGTVERAHERVLTDSTGFARASFAVPEAATGEPPLSLRARVVGAAAEDSLPLGLREETPATPRMNLSYRELELRPAEVGHADVSVVDAAQEPIAGQLVTYWSGPKGTTRPQTDEDWKKNGRIAKTDGLGALVVETPAPKVVTALGSEITLVVRTELEGQKIERTMSVAVGQAAARAALVVETGALVPGVAQRAFLHVDDGEQDVAGDFAVEGDGLKTTVATDAHGDAEVTWAVPDEIGAAREKGPCAGGVAAAVTVRAVTPIAALARHPEPFQLCIQVARERTSILRASPVVARAGTKIHVAAITSKQSARGPGSIVIDDKEGSGRAVWGTGNDDVDLTGVSAGIHTITLATPRSGAAAETMATTILVVPAVLPRIVAKVSGGRMAPGGDVEIDATVDDGHGKPVLAGVSAIVIDKEGGGSVSGVSAMDLRESLCSRAHGDLARCDAFLEGDAETARRRALSTVDASGIAPLGDPAAGATGAMRRTFAEVLKSLEGAVFQAQTPDSLRDVRRREGGAWRFNPELMTLVTAAMDTPPTTPGGEPFGLRDLVAVDPQVSFDVVARRVTRLKLFHVLAALRTYKKTTEVTDDEPVLRDPPALLRRLVRENLITSDQLIDPWGGTLQFLHAEGPIVPFLNIARGWSLHSAGPDGQLGTGDDVRDPFERAVRSGTPYADALGEDEIVDAKWDMRVSDATVGTWTDMFSRLTGTQLGGTGEGGGGRGEGSGFGNGSGRLGGAHSRKGSSVSMDTARWTEPVRTDANGKVHLTVKLGDHETTWRIALVARTDASDNAVTTLDVSAFLPISTRVDLGRKLTLGDEVGARIIVRNRTAAPRPVTIDLAAESGLVLAKGQARVLALDVPPQSARSVFARVIARSEGPGRVTATMHAGSDTDTVTQTISIEPAGEPSVVMATWASPGGKSGHRFRIDLAPGFVPHGAGQLVVASGLDDPLLAAIESLAIDGATPPSVLADAIDVGSRIGVRAKTANDAYLGERAKEAVANALSYLDTFALRDGGKDPRANDLKLAQARAAIHGVGKNAERHRACPELEMPDARSLAYLEAEPAPDANGPIPCFTSVIAHLEPKTAVERARAVHALLDRPHRAPLAASIARDLAQATKAESLDPRIDGTRPERAIILSALARSASIWSTRPEAARTLVDYALSLRDARGGYGTAEATRDVVRALVALEPKPAQAAHVVITEGMKKRTLEIGPNVTGMLPLPATAHDVEVAITGGPVLVRFVRPALRGFGAAPDTTVAPLTVTADWPTEATAGSAAVLHLGYKRGLGAPIAVATTVPLPPGVELAAPVAGVHLRQGVLHIEMTPGESQTLSIPIRFTLPGRFAVPPTETIGRSDEEPRMTTPAQMLVVR